MFDFCQYSNIPWNICCCSGVNLSKSLVKVDINLSPSFPNNSTSNALVTATPYQALNNGTIATFGSKVAKSIFFKSTLFAAAFLVFTPKINVSILYGNPK